MLSKHKHLRALPAFTLLEVMISISVIAVLAGIVTFAATSLQKNTRDTARDTQVRIISDALEKYYRVNGEYPSVAAVTSPDVNTVKNKLAITDPTILKLPGSTTDNSLTTSAPSTTRIVYTANTTDSTKNTQCQTDVNGYCDGYTLQYVQEASGAPTTVTSLKTTFQAVHDSDTCDEGDTQNGTTCTHTYAASYQAGSYTCPSGGTLSGTTCTSTYGASYSSGGSGYYCPSGGSLSGSTCTVTSSYPAASQQFCPTGYSGPSGGTCTASTTVEGTSCPAGYSSQGSTWDPKTSSYHTTCVKYTSALTAYTCNGYLNGSPTCTSTSTYSATYYSYSGYYYCSGGDTLSGSTCTNTYSATQGTSYYTCPNGGTVSGTTCTYTYQLEG